MTKEVTESFHFAKIRSTVESFESYLILSIYCQRRKEKKAVIFLLKLIMSQPFATDLHIL